MDSKDFNLAKIMEHQGWKFLRNDHNEMVFVMTVDKIVYVAKVSKDA